MKVLFSLIVLLLLTQPTGLVPTSPDNVRIVTTTQGVVFPGLSR